MKRMKNVACMMLVIYALLFSVGCRTVKDIADVAESGSLLAAPGQQSGKKETPAGGSSETPAEETPNEETSSQDSNDATAVGEKGSDETSKLVLADGKTEITKEQLYSRGFALRLADYPQVAAGRMYDQLLPKTEDDIMDGMHLADGLVIRAKKVSKNRQAVVYDAQTDTLNTVESYSVADIEVLDVLYGDATVGQTIQLKEDSFVREKDGKLVTWYVTDYPHLQDGKEYILYLRKSILSTPNEMLYVSFYGTQSTIEIPENISTDNKNDMLRSKILEKYVLNRSALDTKIDVRKEVKRYLTRETSSLQSKVVSNNRKLEKASTSLPEKSKLKEENKTLSTQLSDFENRLTSLDTAKTQAEILALVPSEVKDVFERCIENYGTK